MQSRRRVGLRPGESLTFGTEPLDLRRPEFEASSTTAVSEGTYRPRAPDSSVMRQFELRRRWGFPCTAWVFSPCLARWRGCCWRRRLRERFPSTEPRTTPSTVVPQARLRRPFKQRRPTTRFTSPASRTAWNRRGGCQARAQVGHRSRHGRDVERSRLQQQQAADDHLHLLQRPARLQWKRHLLGEQLEDQATHNIPRKPAGGRAPGDRWPILWTRETPPKALRPQEASAASRTAG
jgi:hypothetical protein